MNEPYPVSPDYKRLKRILGSWRQRDAVSRAYVEFERYCLRTGTEIKIVIDILSEMEQEFINMDFYCLTDAPSFDRIGKAYHRILLDIFVQHDLLMPMSPSGKYEPGVMLSQFNHQVSEEGFVDRLAEVEDAPAEEALAIEMDTDEACASASDSRDEEIAFILDNATDDDEGELAFSSSGP